MAQKSLLCCALVALVAAFAAAGAAAQSLTDGAVIDTAAGVAYLMNARGGIDAIELERGALQWSSPAAAKPLAVAGGRLLALALPCGAEPAIVTLDRTGRAVASAALTLPAGVRPTLKDDLNGSFRVEAVSGSGGELLLLWTAIRQPARGVEDLDHALVVGQSPPPEELLSAAGAFRVDTTTGQLRPATTADADTLRTESADAVARGIAALTSGPRTFTAVDGRAQLTSTRQGESQADRHYRWTISAGSRTLGTLESSAATSAFAVRGGTLYYVVPAGGRLAGTEMKTRGLTLRAVDLASGTERWSRSLVETRYFGPFPL